MESIQGLPALRSAVEERIGPLADAVWEDIAPPAYPEAFDEEDVRVAVSGALRHSGFRDARRSRASLLQEVLGLDPSMNLEGETLMAAIGVADAVEFVLKGGPRPSAISAGTAEAVGRFVLAAAAVKLLAGPSGVRGETLGDLLGYREPTDSGGRGEAIEDLVGFVARFGRRARRGTVRRDLALYDADRQIRERFLKRSLAWLEMLAGSRDASTLAEVWIPRFDRRGSAILQRHLGATMDGVRGRVCRRCRPRVPNNGCLQGGSGACQGEPQGARAWGVGPATTWRRAQSAEQKVAG